MGRLIVVCGIDGSGKSSQSKALAEALGGAWTNFPNRSTFYGKLIDAWLRGQWSARPRTERPDDPHTPMGDREAATLDDAVFQAIQTVNRLEMDEFLRHAQRVPGSVLVCDRYWPSAYAYGTAGGLDSEMLVKIHAPLPQPDVCVLIDVTPSVAAERVAARGGDKAEVYEKRGRAYYEKVAAAFDRLWRARMADRSGPTQWLRVESAGTFEQTQATLVEAVRAALG
jgi:dTMP kinase